jgi:hypothetical protein
LALPGAALVWFEFFWFEFFDLLIAASVAMVSPLPSSDLRGKRANARVL